MNEAIESISKKLEEIDIHYELTEEKDGLIISLLNDELGVSITYLINILQYEDGSYKLTIFTGELAKIKNEFEVLKTISDINFNSSFVSYIVRENKHLHIRVETIDTLENIANDSMMFIKNINDSLEKNYGKIMKSNWS